MPTKIPAITVTPKSSRHELLWLYALHATAFIVTLAAPLLLFYKLPLLLLLILLTIARLRGYDFNPATRVVEATIESSGRSKIILGNGRRVAATLRTDSLMTPWLILLRFNVRHRWQHPSMVLFQDALPKEQKRRLCVLLKHGTFHQKGE